MPKIRLTIYSSLLIISVFLLTLFIWNHLRTIKNKKHLEKEKDLFSFFKQNWNITFIIVFTVSLIISILEIIKILV
ncbi:MAG: hypothetical protein E7Y34_02785 [Mycoplasma sp.]|nr:hypothetical protein [Mycoplasma sp.]